MLLPPPPYELIVQRRPEVPPLPSQTAKTSASFSTLPSHIILQIVYSTFPQSDGQFQDETWVEVQRRNLFWLETSLRVVNRALYITCMYILRSTYLPAYTSLVKPPYSSDPFPAVDTAIQDSILDAGNRELRVLDQFIALLAHEDVLLDSTCLHLTRDEAYKDLFDLSQPRSRLEDLVLREGSRMGLVAEHEGLDDDPGPSSSQRTAYLPPPSPTFSSEPSTPTTRSSFNPLSLVSAYREKKKTKKLPPPPTPFLADRPGSERIRPLPFSSLSVSLTPRAVKLLYSDQARCGISLKKTLVEVDRMKDERLEVLAQRLLQALQEVLTEGYLNV